MKITVINGRTSSINADGKEVINSFVYDGAGYSSYRIELVAGDHVVDDALGAQLLKKYPNDIMEATEVKPKAN